MVTKERLIRSDKRKVSAILDLPLCRLAKNEHNVKLSQRGKILRNRLPPVKGDVVENVTIQRKKIFICNHRRSSGLVDRNDRSPENRALGQKSHPSKHKKNFSSAQQVRSFEQLRCLDAIHVPYDSIVGS